MKSHTKMKKKNEFQSLTYVNFIVLQKYRVDAVAQKMGIHVDTLYKKIRGERPWQVDDIPRLVNATGDIGYLEYLCDPCGYMLIPKIKDRATARMFSQMVKVLQSATNGKNEDKNKS